MFQKQSFNKPLPFLPIFHSLLLSVATPVLGTSLSHPPRMLPMPTVPSGNCWPVLSRMPLNITPSASHLPEINQSLCPVGISSSPISRVQLFPFGVLLLLLLLFCCYCHHNSIRKERWVNIYIYSVILYIEAELIFRRTETLWGEGNWISLFSLRSWKIILRSTLFCNHIHCKVIVTSNPMPHTSLAYMYKYSHFNMNVQSLSYTVGAPITWGSLSSRNIC